MTDWNLPPGEIERRSFAIIDEEAPAHDWPADAWRIVRRMVHTSGDFEYVKSVRIHTLAIEAGINALRSGVTIVTDTKMARAGISAARLAPFGVKVECLIDDPEVVRRAKESGSTRAAAAVDLALERDSSGIFVIGNAPTALFRLIERIRDDGLSPALIVGVPVGFVNAAESKDALLNCPAPFVTALGRKGGSNVAASVINALADLAGEA